MAIEDLQKGGLRDKSRRMAAIGKAVILALFCTVLLEGALALYRVNRGYGAESSRSFLEIGEDHDYAQVSADGGVFWTPVGADPWMRSDIKQGTGHIRILLAEPLAQETTVHLYYAQAGQFDRFRRKDGYMMKGTREAVLTVPPGSWDSLRLDILGGFALEGIEAAEAVPLKGLSAGRLLTRAMAQVCWGRAAALFLSLTAAGSLLTGRHRKRDAAVKGAAKKEAKRERIVYLDGIRTLAALLVIVAHVLAPLEGQLFHRSGPLPYLLFLGGMFFALSCNLLFFLLSGALLLPYREESVAVFFRKRFLKVALPLFVYSVFYVRGMCFSVLPWKDWVMGYGKALFSGQMAMAPHLWLVYALIGMYVLVLPFRAILKNSSERTEKQLTLLTIVFLGIRTAGQYLRLEPGISIFLDGWTGIFLMGYFLTRDWMRRYDPLWLKGGAAAFLISLGTGMLRSDYGGIVYNSSILMLAIASALFIAMRELEPRLRPFARPLSAASRYSYSILLIHWYVLYGLIYSGFLPAQMPRILQILLPILACTFLSLALSVIVDHTAVAVLEKALYGTAGVIRHLKKDRVDQSS